MRYQFTDSEVVGLEVYAERIQYEFMPYHRNVKQIPNVKLANKSLSDLAQFGYLSLIMSGWVFKFQCMVYEKCEYCFNRER